MPRSFTFATITEYKAAKGTSGAIYAELVSSGIKSGSCVSKITATGDVFIDSINPFVTPELGQEGDTLYYSSTERYRFLRAGNTTWDANSYGQVYIDLAKIPSGFSVVAPYTDIFNYKKTDENIGSGKASMTKILGNSLAWNSMVTNGNFASTSYWAISGGTISVSGGVLTFTASAANDRVMHDFSFIAGHKYYLREYVKKAVAEDSYNVRVYGYGSDLAFNYTLASSTDWQLIVGVFGIQNSGAGALQAVRAGSVPSGSVRVKGVTMVDLTLLYGASIDGMTDAQILAKFESEFPGYHSYNAGALISNRAKAIEFVGFNKWDEEWDVGWINDQGSDSTANQRVRSKNYIPVISGSQYYFYISSGALVVRTYDANKNCVGSFDAANEVVTIPAGVSFVRFCTGASYTGGTTYNHDICINLSGKRNGQYEPYKKVVLPLPNLDQIKVYSHNLYDHATGKAKVEGGKQYYIGGTYTSISQNGTAITVSSHLFTPSASGDVDVVGGNSTDTIINLSSSFNGQYEPHGILTKTGGLKGINSICDELVGNKFIQRIGRANLAEQTWGIFGSATKYFRTETILNVKNTSAQSAVPNILSPKYKTVAQSAFLNSGDDVLIRENNATSYVDIRDDNYTTVDDFVEAVAGQYIDYELATPIEYEIYSPTKMPFNWKYRVSEYHTKKMLPENAENPTSAPFACEIKQI